MPLESGNKLGGYEILSPIGAGGMGEVYRARDTKLGREVAIKVLPEALSQDKERLARFEREAKLLASLNHAAIATLYGLEEDAGKPFLVMELVEGETLAEQITRGPLSVEVALPLFQQIAEALEAAHEKAVIHRDLKPANIKVTPEGKVKVLDFGLAKAFAPQESEVDDSSQSPTLTKGTALGVIMGTASYMSPEQARGKPVDKRTDIWAFGCCLYETLTGKKTFAGETLTDTISAVLRAEPDWKPLSKHSPHLRGLLARCLHKDRRERLRDIGDARLEIEEVMEQPGHDVAVPPQGRTWRQSVPWALAAVMGIGVIAMWLGGESTGPRPAQVSVVLPPGVLLAVDTEHPALAVSPNGTRLVFVGEEDGIRRLYIRDLAESDAKVIGGTEDAASPFFSPDGEWIGFLAEEWIKKVSVEGGVPVAVHRTSGPSVNRGMTWSTGDAVFVASSANSGLARGSFSGDVKRAIEDWADVTDPSAPYAWPHALPGGGRLLFTDHGQGRLADARVALLDLKTGEIETLARGGTSPRYSTTGHVLFARSGSLYAVPFDAGHAEATGDERKLLDGVMTAENGAAQFAVGSDGTLAYVAGDTGLGEHELVWVDRQGETETLLDGRQFIDPRISPDGMRLAVTSATGANFDIWLLDLERSTFTRLTSDPGEDLQPVWSPGGERLALASEIDEDAGHPGPALAWMSSLNVPPEVLIESPGFGNWEFPSSWSPDGRWLAYSAARVAIQQDVWLFPMGETGEPVAFLEGPANETAAMFSPDGQWVAYVSDLSGRDEVYLQKFPDPGAQVVQVSTRGGIEPVWARDGRELFYREGNKLMVVEFTPGASLQPKAPEVLFEGRYRKSGWGAETANYDVSPDGSRFVMVRTKNLVMPTVIHIVLNWPEALR